MGNPQEKIKLENEIISQLKTVFDPEIPVNIYDLGLVYKIDIGDDQVVSITMTLTAPNCPVADSLPAEVSDKIKNIHGVKDVNVQIVFYPPWSKDMMSETALLELGFL
ncbi:MAG: SUF system Fe-S cluster assembly protein [Bacteroidetes bacterium]|nr:SUF system Fe-S cluster assembly protein [Bacteroidota bacterium]